jgi:hypothetical protein
MRMSVDHRDRQAGEAGRIFIHHHVQLAIREPCARKALGGHDERTKIVKAGVLVVTALRQSLREIIPEVRATERR